MLKVGVIGLGVGERHVEAFQQHSGSMVTAVSDLDREKAVEVADRHGVGMVFNTAEELLTDSTIDVVSIASYDDVHFDQIMLALEHGKHVFAEKPFCLFDHESIAIRSVLNANPHLKFGSNFILRKSPRFLKLKSLIEEGAMGRVYNIEGSYNYGRVNKITEGWRGGLDFYSVVHGGAIHIIDLILSVSGKRVVEVSAVGSRIATEGTPFKFNDSVTAVLEFDDGSAVIV